MKCIDQILQIYEHSFALLQADNHEQEPVFVKMLQLGPIQTSDFRPCDRMSVFVVLNREKKERLGIARTKVVSTSSLTKDITDQVNTGSSELISFKVFELNRTRLNRAKQKSGEKKLRRKLVT